jgi:hypothetical protein
MKIVSGTKLFSRLIWWNQYEFLIAISKSGINKHILESTNSTSLIIQSGIRSDRAAVWLVDDRRAAAANLTSPMRNDPTNELFPLPSDHYYSTCERERNRRRASKNWAREEKDQAGRALAVGRSRQRARAERRLSISARRRRLLLFRREADRPAAWCSHAPAQGVISSLCLLLHD